MTKQITMWKEQSTDYTSWHIEVNGEEFCEIKQECEQWARGGIRARGTKVEGYWVEFADGVMTQWFEASEFRSARAALKAAMDFARSEAAQSAK